MPAKPSKLTRLSGTKLVIGFFLVFIIIIGLALIFGSRLADLYRAQFTSRQEQLMQSPATAVKRQVKRVLLKRETEDGEIEYVEILPNGKVTVYDANMNIKKSGLQGFSRINRLFNNINDNLDNLDEYYSGGGGVYEITIETNQGTTTINTGGGDDGEGEGDEDINDIIEDIEDIEDDTFNPTPTPAPTLTPLPGASPTPLPSPTLPPGIPSPTPTPGPTPTPTPLPDYMTAPPFSCDDYYSSGKPLIITNILCGLDSNRPQ